MVLKKAPKRYQMVWFDQLEDIRLQEFVARDVKMESAINIACKEIINMVLEDDGLRARAAKRIDEKILQGQNVSKGGILHFFECKYGCGVKERKKAFIDIHEKLHCPKRPFETPLVVEVRRR